MRIAAATISADAFGTFDEHVAHEVHPAALPGCADEHRADRLLEPEVVVADHELHAGEAAGAQTLQERGPEGAVFAVADLDAQHFTVAGGGHAGGDDHGTGHDAAADSALDVGGVQEHVGEPTGPAAGRGTRPGRGRARRRSATHLALGDPAGDAERLDEVVDLAGRHAVHVGLHHHREQRPVDAPAPLQQRREERALPQLRISSSTSPAGVDNSRARCPLRWVVRVSVRSCGPAPMIAVASASISCWRIHSKLTCGSGR